MVKHAATSPAERLSSPPRRASCTGLNKEIPGRQFVAADDGAVCGYMKQITLDKVRAHAARHGAARRESPTEPVAETARVADRPHVPSRASRDGVGLASSRRAVVPVDRDPGGDELRRDAGDDPGWRTARASTAALLAEHYYPSGRADRVCRRTTRVSAGRRVDLPGGLARETQRIRLGTLVSPVTFRHPSVLAKMAATLDHLSDGRAELGIGAGWLEPEHQAYGFDFPPAGSPSRPAGRAAAGDRRLVEPGPVHPRRPGRTTCATATSRRSPCSSRARRSSSVAARPPSACRSWPRDTPTSTSSTRRRSNSATPRDRKLDQACEANGRDPAAVRLSAFVAICVGEQPSDVERILEKYRATNPQYMRMLDNRDNWIMGTPEQAQAQLQGWPKPASTARCSPSTATCTARCSRSSRSKPTPVQAPVSPQKFKTCRDSSRFVSDTPRASSASDAQVRGSLARNSRTA